MQNHYTKLEKMYLAAPINKAYNPQIQILHGEAEIEIQVKEEFFHAAQAVHGAVYFKLLDDAAFFAANSVVKDFFVLTVQFQLRLLRPVSAGKLIAKGFLVNTGKTLLSADANLYNEKNKLIASGNGLFSISSIKLETIHPYNEN